MIRLVNGPQLWKRTAYDPDKIPPVYQVMELRFFKDGILHRNDGPAIEGITEPERLEWIINGKNITAEVLEYYKNLNIESEDMQKDNARMMFKLTFGG